MAKNNIMSIKKKAFIFSFFFLIIFTVLLIVVVEINLWDGFNLLEDQFISRAIDRSEFGVSDRIARIDSSLNDWTHWNDSYDYTLGNYPEFINNNISENQFISLGLNYIAFLNNDGEIIFSKAFDLENRKYIDLPDHFLLDALKSIVQKPNSEIINGIIHNVDFGPTLIAIRPLLKTDGSGPSSGMLIFARKIDSGISKDISKITSFDFSFFSSSEIDSPIFSENAVKNLRDQNIYIEKDNSDIAYGYSRFLNDLDDDRDLILRVAVPRDIYKNGMSVSIKLTVSLLIASLFATIIFMYIVNNIIVKRLSFLVNKISDVESGRAESSDIVLSGKDEVSFLAEKLRGAIERSLEEKNESFSRSSELEQSQKAILNVLEDIELEKNKIESLATDLEKFKLAVENASDLIVITDPDGVVIYANKAVEKITGYPIKEIIGSKPSLWGRQMSKEFYEKLWKTIKEDKLVFNGEINNKRKNGEIYIAEASISPILNSRGKIIFFIGIERDITLLKEISDAKTEFVSVASHQLRTPLTGIKWLTEILLKNREGNLSEKQKETLREINFSNDRVINLVNDLLSISRIERGQSKALTLSSVNMFELVNEVVGGLKPIAENGKVNFEAIIDLPKDHIMNIDEEKIRQSMTNLISNAIKYSKADSGRVDVSAQIKDGDFVFVVKDNGIGIPLKDQRHMFEKFYRADNAVLNQTEGTGLGLYIVKSYIEAHGGKLWFESEENKGSTFYFSLKIN